MKLKIQICKKQEGRWQKKIQNKETLEADRGEKPKKHKPKKQVEQRQEHEEHRTGIGETEGT